MKLLSLVASLFTLELLFVFLLRNTGIKYYGYANYLISAIAIELLILLVFKYKEAHSKKNKPYNKTDNGKNQRSPLRTTPLDCIQPKEATSAKKDTDNDWGKANFHYERSILNGKEYVNQKQTEPKPWKRFFLVNDDIAANTEVLT